MRKALSGVVILSILSGYFYVLMDWLFFVTKPSFFYRLSGIRTFGVLLMAPIAPVIICILPIGLLFPFYAVTRRVPPLPRWFAPIALAIPAFVVAATIFLMIDNFTYTVFNRSMDTFHRKGRYLAAFAFIVIVAGSLRSLCAWGKSTIWESRSGRHIARLCCGLLGVSFMACGIALAGTRSNLPSNDPKDISSFRSPSRRPNILILSADGLDTSRLSAYGYRRDTSPFIRSLLPQSLLFENYFVNASQTTGSVASLLTGRLSTRTGVVFPPDIFIVEDAFRHMPGILRGLGYRTADFSIRYYADPYDLNLREGFDEANGRKEKGPLGVYLLPGFIRRAFVPERYFLEQSFDRVRMRLTHAFVRDVGNPFKDVTRPGADSELDSRNVVGLKSYLDKCSGPFFIHMHFMNTHGPMFPDVRHVFSDGRQQTKAWDEDFFDDAILDFDTHVRDIVARLREKGILDDTILVITSDHGPDWVTDRRVPLIIRFPRGKPAGKVARNVQSLDIAPTILESIGIDAPPWMEGESLLSGKSDSRRPILAVQLGEEHRVNAWKYSTNPRPPFFSMGGISAVVCQRYYSLSFRDGTLRNHDIEGHTTPCNEQTLPSPEAVRGLLLAHLGQAGYDVSSISQR